MTPRDVEARETIPYPPRFEAPRDLKLYLCQTRKAAALARFFIGAKMT